MPFAYPENDPNARLIRYPNPTYEGGWPAAESSKIFILGAVAAAGAALHGENWTGREPVALRWPESPKDALARSRKPIPTSISSNRLPLPRKTPKDLEAEDADAIKRQVAWVENGLAVARLMRAVNWLAQRCRDGDLKPYARPASGGEVMPMLASEWNIDDPFEQFVMKGGNRRRFISGGYASPPMESFVFFDRTELQEVLAREAGAKLEIGTVDLSRLSPFLRLAVRVAIEQGYFSDSATPKIAARAYQIEVLWNEYLPGVPFSPSAAEQLARFIGFPDAKAIENGRKGGRGRKSRIPH